MINKVIDISVNGSVGQPTMTTYFISPSDSYQIHERPCVVICPGGGYGHVSDREGEFLALGFNARGINAVVIRYSVAPARYPVALLELAKGVKYIREHSEEFEIDPNRILVQGSSAGAHLAASFAIFTMQDEFISMVSEEIDIEDSKDIKVNGIMLSYPVITSGEYAHRGSFECLLGEKYDELVDIMSLENQKLEGLPPVFLWHTYADNTVPVENSILFMLALRKAKVPFESHIYPMGSHGLALGNELTTSKEGKELVPYVSSWFGMACEFVNKFIV